MPNKTQEYLNLAQQTAKELTRYWENWTDYLTTASRLYKYNFADQLMIYAQRPDATACASFDLWNDRMNRYVRRGSKGIALLDQSSSVPRLHYVFDVSDTGVRRNSRDPEVWQLGPDLVQPVSEMLAREYGIRHERITQQIADICGKLVDSYWDNNSGDILDIVDGSLLMDYDEAGQEFQFKSAAAISILYTVLERCGLEPDGHFDRDDFQAIFSFSTPAAVYALGTAVSECSRDVLRNIERTVKTTIRRRNVERSQYEYEQQERDLLDHRGLPAPEPDPAPAGESTGQVRAAAPDLPDEASPGAVQLDTVKEVRPRYSCFYKIRHPGDCDGQSGYGVSKLDSIVEEVVRQIFAQFREVSRKKLLESVKTNDAARIQKKIKKIQKDLESKQKELDDLKAETILVIRGVSALDKELLGTLVAEAREALETLEKQLVQAQNEYEEATKTAKRSNYICNELFTWADVYDTANHDERRAILQQFIKEIRVRKDYEISITLNASFNQVEQLKAVSTYDGAGIFEEISEKGA